MEGCPNVVLVLVDGPSFNHNWDNDCVYLDRGWHSSAFPNIDYIYGTIVLFCTEEHVLIC